MKRSDVVRMAREAGCPDIVIPREWFRFAKLVAAAEREACAKVCDAKVDAEYATGKVDHNEMGWTQACAFAIRERGAP
jgi:hypothetical protein